MFSEMTEIFHGMLSGLDSVDFYMLAIVALFPLTAGLLVSQVNPYQALVIRGILGAIAALIYVLFGAADVALTEALVGTMLSITLYAIAVRSSMSMRLGILAPKPDPEQTESTIKTLMETPIETPMFPSIEPSTESTEISIEISAESPLETPVTIDPLKPYRPILSALRTCLRGYHLRLEIVSYSTVEELQQALQCQAVQSICIPASPVSKAILDSSDSQQSYSIQTRLWRLYEILEAGLFPTIATLTYHPGSNHPNTDQNITFPETVEL